MLNRPASLPAAPVDLYRYSTRTYDTLVVVRCSELGFLSLCWGTKNTHSATQHSAVYTEQTINIGGEGEQEE